MDKLTVSLIGGGQRGNDIYGNYILNHFDEIEIVAVVEPDSIKRRIISKAHNIIDENVFDNWDDFFKREKLSDAVIIATPDNKHYIPTKKALEKNYHILLEKPMSNNPEETMELGNLAMEHKNIFMIAHVLRYTGFYSQLKSLIDKKVIGDIMTIQHSENIGYYHFAHSFVRGNWRNSELSSPLILQKSCHDMDILSWLANSNCKEIASFGELTYFKKENKPVGGRSRCTECSIENECIYSAKKQYYNNIGVWPTTAITPVQTMEEIVKAVENGPYGKCVFDTDNNVVDHQSTIIKFENNITVDFTLSAFTNEIYREIRIMGTKGEIRGNDRENKISIKEFGTNIEKIIKPETTVGGHGGGDTGIMNDFVSLLKGDRKESLTAASKSVESHMMAFAAEKSRTENRIINMEEYYNSF